MQIDRGRLLVSTGFGLLVVLIGGFAIFSSVCPCERIPGGHLFGESVDAPVADWSFANQAPLCQIQVGELLPHSINLNCMADPTGALYLSCSHCDGKHWSTLAVEDPDARIRIDGRVYPVTLTRVEDPDALDTAWRARALKTGTDPATNRSADWWSFRVQSR